MIVTIDISVEQIIIEVNNNPVAIKGDKGDKGDAGAGVDSLEFAIETPSYEWIINHNKGYYPSVVILNIVNNEMMAEVQYSSLNQCIIRFSSNQVGKVIVN